MTKQQKHALKRERIGIALVYSNPAAYRHWRISQAGIVERYRSKKRVWT